MGKDCRSLLSLSRSTWLWKISRRRWKRPSCTTSNFKVSQSRKSCIDFLTIPLYIDDILNHLNFLKRFYLINHRSHSHSHSFRSYSHSHSRSRSHHYYSPMANAYLVRDSHSCSIRHYASHLCHWSTTMNHMHHIHMSPTDSYYLRLQSLWLSLYRRLAERRCSKAWTCLSP